MRYLLALCLSIGFFAHTMGQNGTISGRMFDEGSNEGLPSGKVILVGTYKGALTDGDGNFIIKDIKPGDYTLRAEFGEFTPRVFTGIRVKAGEDTKVKVPMKEVKLATVIITGEADLIDVEDGRSGGSFSADDIAKSNFRNALDVVKNVNGVDETPDGIQVRGSRTYETENLVDGISAKDPLAGYTGGLTVSANSIESIDVVTGGGDAEFGGGTGGVINTRIKSGGDKYQVRGSWYRDNFGANPNWSMGWNSDIANLALSGPVPGLKDKLTFFTSVDLSLTDAYFGTQAGQLHSSLFTNDSMWAPRQNNSWSNTAKLTWKIKPGMKLSVTNQHSLGINQNSRTLQIVGNDAILTPGFPYAYSLNLDNANTYTHHSNLTVVNFKTQLDTSAKWVLDVNLGRLFTTLQADANGRPFRESTVDRLYDPASIVTNPVDVANPGDSVVFVFPGPGLFNNDGIGTLWHNHHAEEYTLKYKFTHRSKSKVHKVNFGQEHKEKEYLWIDVTRPWVGAPIQIDDTTFTPSTSIGSSSDVWLARPSEGGFFFQDEIRYKGIIAYLGARLMYWAPGKFADDAVNNPDAPVVDQIREDYMDQTFGLAGKRWKARLLPKIRVSFPVTDNNVLYFNYGHAAQLPHPRFVYAGLDPVYQDRSFLSNLGNPNINPEVTVNYEIGLKSKINQDLALTVTAFYNDKFDYIVSRRILIRDQNNRFVSKTFFINQDYARIRGVEVGIQKRFKKVFKVVVNSRYQIATGKSNTAAESALQIQNQGFVNSTKENFLAWDRPFDNKLLFYFTPDSTVKLFGKSLQGFRVFVSAVLKSGLRYTPFEYTGDAQNGRPQYERVDDSPFSEIASPWFWTDMVISRDFNFGAAKDKSLSLSVEFKNLFNNRNAQIINGVTGRAYQDGDPLPLSFRDPAYPSPQDRGLPPYNPARFRQPRQMIVGLSFQF